jgi:hypothetical protein
MKLFLVLAATLFAAMPPIQTVIPPAPEIVVVKFSYGKQDRGGHMIRSVQEPDPPMNEPIRIDLPKKDEPQEIKNRRDMQERRADMRAAEINAALSNQKATTIYFYHLEVKNTSTRVVKNFAWSYQPGDSPDPSDRQFFCVIKAKPSANREFDLFTPLAPSRVVDASKAGDKPKQNSKGSVVINKIEYMDGSVWKRPAWNPATFPAEATEKLANGKCIGL